jgi:hypothetical protein
MNLNLFVFLTGLFGVPLVLLMYAHRLRRRSPRARAAFWGAIAGHCIAATLALFIGMIPAEAWSSGDTTRGLIGFWGLLVLPLMGAVIAVALWRGQEMETA